MKITLDARKSIEENAGIYYDKAKKAKKKLQGLREALEKTRLKAQQQEEILAQKEALDAKQELFDAAEADKEWYEKFRWFYTSSGKLAVGGRDAHSNEQIIKKYAEAGDIVFHTDMAGSPFFVLKQGADSTDQDKAEVAHATVSFSRAWQKGLVIDVFWVLPEQVTKEANAGESLSTGAFVIRGKTNYVAVNNLSIGIGVQDHKIISGPPEVIQERADKTIVVSPGDMKVSDAAKRIRKFFHGGNLDVIIRMLPTGGVKLG